MESIRSERGWVQQRLYNDEVEPLLCYEKMCYSGRFTCGVGDSGS